MKFHLLRRSRDFCVRNSILLVGCGPPLLLIAVFVGSVTYTTVRERFHRLPFDSAQWQEPQDFRSTDPVRIRMVDDLLSRYQLVGMTREQAVALLGEPLKNRYSVDTRLDYWLGPKTGFMALENEWLILTLDANQAVVAAQVVSR